jgi:lysophospholipase L1-like esterase
MSRSWVGLLAVAASLLGSGVAARADGWDVGVGVLGDSLSDEYRFYPPHRTRSRSWVEILAEIRGVNFGAYDPDGSSRGEPRNAGFAYNWSRSGATTASLLAQGQHTGVAAQVARGEVGLVWINIGCNDVLDALHAADPTSALRAATEQAPGHLARAVETILAASRDVKVVLVTIPDPASLPEIREDLRAGRLERGWVDRAGQSVRRFNASIWALAARDERLSVVDLYWTLELASKLAQGHWKVAGRDLRAEPGADRLDHAFLADGRHPGTLVQGLLARLFIDTVNNRFQAGLRRLDDAELLSHAERVEAELGRKLAGSDTAGAFEVTSIPAPTKPASP